MAWSSLARMWVLPLLCLLADVTDAGGGGDEETKVPFCHDKDSFLGVGNPTCITRNKKTTLFLIACIIAISIAFETLVHHIKHAKAIHAEPQLQELVEKIIEEVMILGFISMTFFAMNTLSFSGGEDSQTITQWLASYNDQLTGMELFHFKEFFHYLIFLAMCYYLATVLVLITSAHYLPSLWHKLEMTLRGRPEGNGAAAAAGDGGDGGDGGPGGPPDDSEAASASLTAASGAASDSSAAGAGAELELPEDSVTKEYCKLKEQRQMYGWRVKARPKHWVRWWLAVNRMAYKLSRQSSRDVYEDREIVEIAFGVPMHAERVIDYPAYSVLATRAVLIKMCEIHPSAWALLLLITLLNEARHSLGGRTALSADQTKTMLSAVWAGLALFVVACVLLGKSFQVLQGIVNDRVVIFYKNGKIQRLVVHEEDEEEAGAGAGTSTGAHADTSSGDRRRSQMIVSRRLVQTRFHRRRYWFGKPKLLVRLLTFLNFFQSIFLAILSLMFMSIGRRTWGGGGLVLMVIWPLLITCLVLPATLPVLTLALDLSGYIGADQLEKLKHRHEHHGHARSRGMSVAEEVRFCPFCGSQRLVRQGRMRCANCGADGIATKVSVQNPEIGAHVRAKRAVQGATRLLGHFKRAHGAVKVSSKQKLKAGAKTAASKAPGQRPQLSDAEQDVPYSA